MAVTASAPQGCRRFRLLLVAGLISATALGAATASGDTAGLVASDAARQAIQIALETRESGSVYAWQSRDGTLTGKVTPRRTFRTTEGIYCREFVETVADGTDSLTRVHIACRDAAGVWLIVEE